MEELPGMAYVPAETNSSDRKSHAVKCDNAGGARLARHQCLLHGLQNTIHDFNAIRFCRQSLPGLRRQSPTTISSRRKEPTYQSTYRLFVRIFKHHS